MDVTELKERIKSWEDLHTEFKEWPIHPDDLAASLVAFANTDGGQLIFGVSKNHELRGVEDADRVMREVDNIAANNCEPPITVIQEVLNPAGRQGRARSKTVKVPGKNPVIVVNIPKGEARPYRTNRGVFYIRTTSGRRQASREELLRLFQATESSYYDETPLLRLTITDLDLDALNRYLEETGQEDLKGNRERLFIFEDRIEIHTPGKPPNSVDEASMRAGVHVVRNPRIYARLSDAGLVTRAGTGVRRIIRLVKQATGRDAEIGIRDFEVLLTIPRRAATP